MCNYHSVFAHSINLIIKKKNSHLKILPQPPLKLLFDSIRSHCCSPCHTWLLDRHITASWKSSSSLAMFAHLVLCEVLGEAVACRTVCQPQRLVRVNMGPSIHKYGDSSNSLNFHRRLPEDTSW